MDEVVFDTIRPTEFTTVNFILPGVLLVAFIIVLIIKKYKIAIGLFVAIAGVCVLSFLGIQEAKDIKPIKVYDDRIEVGEEKIFYDDIKSFDIFIEETTQNGSTYESEKVLLITRKKGEEVEIDNSDYDVEKIYNEVNKLRGDEDEDEETKEE